MLLQEAIKRFEHYLKITDKSSETVRSYLNDLISFQQFLEYQYNCPLYLDEIQVSDIEDFLYFLKSKNLQAASRSRNLYTLRSFWNYAYKNKLCKWNIAIGVEPIKLQTKERAYLSLEEIQVLIQAIDHSLIRLVVQTLFYTGLRINECLSLKLKDVDLGGCIIHVIGGKGNKDRNIPINQQLLPLLDEYIKNDRALVNSDFFFATKKSGRLTPQYVNLVINDTVKKLGWTKHISAHILRHTFASTLIKNGVNLVYVQKLLGHSNLKVTSIYTHANMDDLHESVNSLTSNLL